MSIRQNKSWNLDIRIFQSWSPGEIRKKISRVLLACEVPTRAQQKHVDTRGHVAMKCKQDIFVAEWTPVDTAFYELAR